MTSNLPEVRRYYARQANKWGWGVAVFVVASLLVPYTMPFGIGMFFSAIFGCMGCVFCWDRRSHAVDNLRTIDATIARHAAQRSQDLYRRSYRA